MTLSGDRLDAIPREHLRALGERLAAGDERVAASLRVIPALPLGMRLPMVAWHLAALHDPVADAARLFFAGDSLSSDDAATALGPALCDALLAHGLLLAEDGRVRAALRLESRGGVAEIADEGGAAAAPGLAEGLLAGKVDRALMVGGSTSIAPMLGLARRLVTIAPRPLLAAVRRANAALAGATVDRVETVDAPDEEARFDLVAIELRFDDPIERVVLSRAVAALAPGGTLIAVVESVDRGLLGALAPAEAQVLALTLPMWPIDEACASRAAARHPELGEAYERELGDLMARWAPQGDAVEVARVALVARRAEPAWTATRSLASTALEELPLAATFASCSLARADDAALRRARVAITAGTRARDVAADVAAGAAPGIALRPPLHEAAVVVDAATADLFARLHAAPSVDKALEGVARAANAPLDAVRAATLPSVREALSTGLLTVVS
ncbi:MAG: hypothetical protein HYV09_37660 [Deltaproteobacteria bacterium]|nr:hypothetical protein [Deltaproteobacteria bacterium]